MGPDIWQDANGNVDPTGLAWVSRVKETWKGVVYVMGQYATISKTNKCAAARPNLNRAPLRMHLRLRLAVHTDQRYSTYRHVFRLPS